MIDAGFRSKRSRTIVAIRSSGRQPVPNVSTATDTGSAMPIAYAT